MDLHVPDLFLRRSLGGQGEAEVDKVDEAPVKDADGWEELRARVLSLSEDHEQIEILDVGLPHFRNLPYERWELNRIGIYKNL